MSKYLYYKVRCEEAGYSSGSLGTQGDAEALVGFIMDNTSTGTVFQVVGFPEHSRLSTVVEELRRETRQEELERIEKLFHYQESVEGLYP